MRYFYAVLACIAVTMAFMVVIGLISSALGGDSAGNLHGAIPNATFHVIWISSLFYTLRWTWRSITIKDGNQNEQGVTQETMVPSDSDNTTTNARLYSDDKYFSIAFKEIEVNRLHKGLWAMALAYGDGNLDKTKSFYIRERTKQLKNMHVDKLGQNSPPGSSFNENALDGHYNFSAKKARIIGYSFIAATTLILLITVGPKIPERNEQVNALAQSLPGSKDSIGSGVPKDNAQAALSFVKKNKMTDFQTKVKLTTSLGAVVIQLDNAKAPNSSANFAEYVKQGFYNGTIFHRVIPGFMAQGGGFDTSFAQKSTNAPIKNEADNGLKNKRGTIAMARTNDPHSATAQFFINYKHNAFLDHTSPTPNGWGYAVFGEVVEGMDVVDAMAKQPIGNRGGHQDVPKTDIVIETAEIVE